MSLVDDLQALQTALDAAVTEAQAQENGDPTWQAVQNVLITAGWTAPAELPEGDPTSSDVENT